MIHNVALVGEPTGGILSDAIGRTLPNGWKFALSSEIYSDTEGRVYEGTGIPVDHVVDFFVVENILAGRDTAIERVFSLVNQDKGGQLGWSFSPMAAKVLRRGARR